MDHAHTSHEHPVCMYVCIYIYIIIYMYIHTHIDVHILAHARRGNTRTYIHIYIYIYTYVYFYRKRSETTPLVPMLKVEVAEGSPPAGPLPLCFFFPKFGVWACYRVVCGFTFGGLEFLFYIVGALGLCGLGLWL